MPLVLIQYKEQFVEGRLMSNFVKELASLMPIFVAAALDSEKDGDEARLAPNDVEVWCNESGKLDVNTKNLEIIIWANEYPYRKDSLKNRNKILTEDVRQFFSHYGVKGMSGFVWTLLQPAAFDTL